MKIIRGITAHEMARRFAIGEIRSQFLLAPDKEYRDETLRFLTSGNPDFELEGIRRHQLTRGEFVNSIPRDTNWHLALLSLSNDEFARLRTINRDGWRTYSNGTLRLVDAATYLREDPSRDTRVAKIITACQWGTLEMLGITLFAQTVQGPYTIVEGTGRLVVLYLCCILSTSSLICTDEVEVILGISSTHWQFS